MLPMGKNSFISSLQYVFCCYFTALARIYGLMLNRNEIRHPCLVADVEESLHVSLFPSFTNTKLVVNYMYFIHAPY